MSAGLLKLVEKQNKDLRDEVARLREALVQKETQIETLLRRKERLSRKGLPHMTPQDDLTAERAALAIFEEIKHGDEQHQAWLRETLLQSPALKTVRQEALRDVLSDLDSLHWKDHWYADQLRRKINERLL